MQAYGHRFKRLGSPRLAVAVLCWLGRDQAGPPRLGNDLLDYHLGDCCHMLFLGSAIIWASWGFSGASRTFGRHWFRQRPLRCFCILGVFYGNLWRHQAGSWKRFPDHRLGARSHMLFRICHNPGILVFSEASGTFRRHLFLPHLLRRFCFLGVFLWEVLGVKRFETDRHFLLSPPSRD